MSPSMIIAAEMTLVLGVVLGLAVWELWQLKRDRDRRKPPAEPPRDEP
ncbi:MAG: hypothetical protein V4844_00650 [Pseudomonadota bacterium]|jgi:hypothetical protein